MESQVWVKMRKSHNEHLSTAVAQKADPVLHRGERPLRATTRLMHRNKRRVGLVMIYSITSSARAISVGGTISCSGAMIAATCHIGNFVFIARV